MEELLHYVWKHKIFPLQELRTTAGGVVEVIDMGLANTDAGPDFFNAKLKIDGTLWVGNVEVHTRASDWFKHGHHTDAAYNNVVLHVVEEADAEVSGPNGVTVPQMRLAIPSHVQAHYRELRASDIYPPCYPVIVGLPKLVQHTWLTALQAERLEQKARQIGQRLRQCDGQWEDAFFVTLARNFGFGLNGDAFEAWALKLPYRALSKHRDSLFQIEAFFFGVAGLLHTEPVAPDDYYLRLQREYRYLSHKFDLPEALHVEQWRFLRLRPGNFPHVRLAQLANLYHRQESLFSRVMEAAGIVDVRRLFEGATSEFWETHFCFNRTSPRRVKQVGKSSLNLLIINTVVPFLYAYGRYRNEERLCYRASDFLESMKAEDNYITRQWDGAGLHVQSAADSQALIQLRKEYCDKRDCLRCRFGFEYLRAKD